jgi:hypothetical protein
MPCIRSAAFFLAAALFFLAGSAVAQSPQPEAVKAKLGAWEISNADRDKVCMVTLRPEPAPGGHKLEFAKGCADAFALVKGIAAWTISRDKMRFVDAKGKTILELDEVEQGMFEGERPGEGLYFMQSVAATAPARTSDQMVGDWAVMQGSDKPICTLTFSNTAAADGFAVKVKPGCDAAVSAFNPTSWRLDRGELVVSSARGGPWRFEEGDPTTWRRVPESADPVWLVRQ